MCSPCLAWLQRSDTAPHPPTPPGLVPLRVPQQRLQQQALVLRRPAPPGPVHPGLPEAGGCEPRGDGHEVQAGAVPALS
jgi:hypothetical protein